MSEAEREPHTKGPWRYSRDGDYWSVGPFKGKDNGEGNEADYHLASAAPDLLAALTELVEKGEDCLLTPGCSDPACCRWGRARHALHTATGAAAEGGAP